MNLTLKNALPLHFPISLNFIHRFLHPSSKSRAFPETAATDQASKNDSDIRFFENADDMENYVRSFQIF